MFLAKIKTATLVLCGVAALGLGTGGVYYQTRVLASDSPKRGKVVSENQAAHLETKQQEMERLRKALEQTRMEKENLFLQAKKWEKQVRLLEAELKTQKRQVAIERSPAENALRQGEERADAARKTETRSQPTRRDIDTDKQNPNAAVEQLEAARRELKIKYGKRFDALKEQLRQLDAEQKTLQARRHKLEDEQKLMKHELLKHFLMLEMKKAKIMQEQAAKPPTPKERRSPRDGDKLDEILQRLERLEKRLDRLERDRK